MLSNPPLATRLPDGAYAHVMTHADRSGIAWIFSALVPSHTISLLSWEAETRFLKQGKVFQIIKQLGVPMAVHETIT
jgi:hypothetical protein